MYYLILSMMQFYHCRKCKSHFTLTNIYTLIQLQETNIGSGVSGSNVLHVIVVTMGVYNGVVVFVSEERFGVVLDTL